MNYSWVLCDIDHSINVALFIRASSIIHFDIMLCQKWIESFVVTAVKFGNELNLKYINLL